MYNPFKKPTPQDPERELPSTQPAVTKSKDELHKEAAARAFNRTFKIPPLGKGIKKGIMDSALSQQTAGGYLEALSTQQLDWFGAHAFIGYQSCAMIAQHWLVDNACTIPVEDSIRKGWELTRNDGKELDEQQKQAIKDIDDRININQKLYEFGKFGRVYGVRVAVFLVESDDPDYYELPFNIDGVKPGSYKGILMNDPYYCIPIVDSDASDPNSTNFYEPTFWQIGGKRYHKSHCAIFIHSDVPQILKPTYIYGGVSLTQQIFESVYNAEITASEVPQLVQTMRQKVLHVDLQQALADQYDFDQRMSALVDIENNYSTRLIGTEEKLEYFQTTLTDLDDLVAGRYRIVASIAQIPVAKLMKTDLTGGLVKGGGEEAIYHETLESLQTKLMPMLAQHYQLTTKSAFGTDLKITPVFNKLDAMTEAEAIACQKIKTEIDEANLAMRSITELEVRKRLIADKNSGYNGIVSGDLPEPDFGRYYEEELDNQYGAENG